MIGRRNREYAGTRYLKRGINDQGNVANEVETEQILQECSTNSMEKPIISSYIHIRGSVPVRWYQEASSFFPKPLIKVNTSDVFFKKSRLHFNDLMSRYGYPVIAANLTREKESEKQETLLNEHYELAIRSINNELPKDFKIKYTHYDLKSERRKNLFYKEIYELANSLIQQTNTFLFAPYSRHLSIFTLKLQQGVVRSNCVDCLDRTNVFQQVIGMAVLHKQLKEMGFKVKKPESEDYEIYGILTELYKQMGHILSCQYAGSLAHKQTINDLEKSALDKIMSKFPEIINVFKRFVSNSFNDSHKQQSINLFLGKYVCNEDMLDLWDMPSDAPLHKNKNVSDLPVDWYLLANSEYLKQSLLNDFINKIDVKEEFYKDIGIEQVAPNSFKIYLERYHQSIPENLLRNYESQFFFQNTVEWKVFQETQQEEKVDKKKLIVISNKDDYGRMKMIKKKGLYNIDFTFDVNQDKDLFGDFLNPAKEIILDEWCNPPLTEDNCATFDTVYL